jgi:ferredoxin-NADP reductase
MPGATGYFDLTVKRYETGTISKYLHDREIGDTVLMSGPNSGGHWVNGMAKQVGFVAGGTGITPMISIIRWILAESLAVELFLVFANKAEADIIFREEWDEDARGHASSIVITCWSSRHGLGAGHSPSPAMRASICPRPVDSVIFSAASADARHAGSDVKDRLLEQAIILP